MLRLERLCLRVTPPPVWKIHPSVVPGGMGFLNHRCICRDVVAKRIDDITCHGYFLNLLFK